MGTVSAPLQLAEPACGPDARSRWSRPVTEHHQRNNILLVCGDFSVIRSERTRTGSGGASLMRQQRKWRLSEVAVLRGAVEVAATGPALALRHRSCPFQGFGRGHNRSFLATLQRVVGGILTPNPRPRHRKTGGATGLCAKRPPLPSNWVLAFPIRFTGRGRRSVSQNGDEKSDDPHGFISWGKKALRQAARMGTGRTVHSKARATSSTSSPANATSSSRRLLPRFRSSCPSSIFTCSGALPGFVRSPAFRRLFSSSS